MNCDFTFLGIQQIKEWGPVVEKVCFLEYNCSSANYKYRELRVLLFSTLPYLQPRVIFFEIIFELLNAKLEYCRTLQWLANCNFTF